MVNDKIGQETRVPYGTILMVQLSKPTDGFTEHGVGFGHYSGWYICDGQNDTPDLRGKFLVGFDNRELEYNQIGKTGGLAHVQLTINEMPTHTHNDSGHSHPINFVTSTDGSHDHLYNDIYYSEDKIWGFGNWVNVPGGFGGFSKDYDNVGHQMGRTTGTSGAHSHSVIGNSIQSVANLTDTGGNQTHENRPPYFATLYIIYKPKQIFFPIEHP
jgi:microcystin-dependent protein